MNHIKLFEGFVNEESNKKSWNAMNKQDRQLSLHDAWPDISHGELEKWASKEWNELTPNIQKMLDLYDVSESRVDENKGFNSRDNQNVWKVMKSEKPITGPTIFDDSGKQFDEAMAKLEKNLKSHEEHYKTSIAKKEELIKQAEQEQKTGWKGKVKWYQDSKKPVEAAWKLLNDAKAFMEKFNKLYHEHKDDMCGTDHVKVAKALYAFFDIYPYNLTNDAGKLKHLRRAERDNEFVKSALRWVDEIIRNYVGMQNQGKNLGKTDKQIDARAKNAAAMRMRWGGF